MGLSGILWWHKLKCCRKCLPVRPLAARHVNLLDFAIKFGPKAHVYLADKCGCTRFCLGK